MTNVRYFAIALSIVFIAIGSAKAACSSGQENGDRLKLRAGNPENWQQAPELYEAASVNYREERDCLVQKRMNTRDVDFLIRLVDEYAIDARRRISDGSWQVKLEESKLQTLRTEQRIASSEKHRTIVQRINELLLSGKCEAAVEVLKNTLPIDQPESIDTESCFRDRGAADLSARKLEAERISSRRKESTKISTTNTRVNLELNRRCEELAGNRTDHLRSEGIKGVKESDISIDTAYAACSGALNSQPTNVTILYNLGRVYNRMGNKQKASELWKAAAARKYPAAMFNLSLKHDPIHGDDKDAIKAFKLVEEAAKLGHPRSMSNLGFYLRYGHGTAENCQEAINWWKRAMELNDSTAFLRMGVEYEYGTCGTPRNFHQARMLYEAGIALGDDYGQTLIAQLEDTIRNYNRQQRDEARQLRIAECEERNYSGGYSAVIRCQNGW